MFNKNNLISTRQIFKMYFTTSIASGILLLLYDYSSVYEGLYTIFATYIFSLVCLTLYSKYLSKKASVSNTINTDSRLHYVCTKALNVILTVKYGFILFITLYLLGYSVLHILGIPSYNIVHLIVLILMVIYIERSTTEQMARFSELTFCIVAIPLVIIIATTITKASPSILLDAFHYRKYDDFSLLRVIIMAIILGKILFPVEILKSMNSHLSVGYSNNIASLKKSLILSLTAAMVTVLTLYIVIVGIFGNVSTDYTIHPFFSLMQMISINTTLEGRLESVVCICIFTSLIYSLAYYLKLMKQAMNNVFPKTFPKYIIFILLAVVASLTVSNIGTSKSNITPEERLVVKNIYIEENGYIYVEVFDMEDDTRLYETKLSSLRDVEESFISEYNVYLDFSHTNNIVVADNIFRNTTILKDLLLEYKKDLRFPENLTVIDLDDNNQTIPLYKLYIDSNVTYHHPYESILVQAIQKA